MTEQAEGIVAEAHVGSGKVLSKKQTIRFHFDDFADLPHNHGEEMYSPHLPCHGHTWKVSLYPRGDEDTDEDGLYISVYLFLVSSETNKVMTRFAFRVTSAGYQTNPCPRHEFRTGVGRGLEDFVERDRVLNPADNFLVDGTLTIEVDIQVYLTKPEKWTFHKTPQPEWLKMLDECDDLEGIVTFAVGETKFPTHRCVLKLRAPGLAELAHEYPNQDVPIDDVDASIFEVLRHFIYSYQLPKDFNLAEKSAKTLLIVADKYGCSSMKLFAEAKLVETAITVDTASELLLLADSKNCALLKEAVISFFVANKDRVMESEGFSQVEESGKLVCELLKAKGTALVGNESHDVDRMGVASLRRKLDEEGLDVDGTREMLVKRLKTAHEDESGDNAEEDDSGDSDSS